MTSGTYAKKRRLPYRRLINRVVDIGLPLFTVMCLGWAADGLKGDTLFEFMISDEAPSQWAARIAVVLLTIILAVFIYLRRRRYLPLRSLSQNLLDRPCRAVVLTLSPYNIEPEFSDGEEFPVKVCKKQQEKKHEVTLQGDLESDLEELISAAKVENGGIRWNWQQVLRALAPHKGSLERIYILASEGDSEAPLPQGEGSYKHLEKCRLLLSKYFPDATIEEHGLALDFENLEALTAAMHEKVREAVETLGIDESDVIIDATGGRKTTSIAAALVTLARKIKFQYVPEHHRGQNVVYDVILESPTPDVS